MQRRKTSNLVSAVVLFAAMSKIASVSAADVETPIPLAQVPATARKTLQREAAGATLEKVDKLSRDGRILYETDAKIDGHNYEIIVTAEGLLVSKVLDEGEEEEDEDKKDKDENEEDAGAAKQVSLPEPVVTTFKAKFPQARIHKSESEVENGVTVYDIEFRERDVEKETDIVADGTMLEYTIVIDVKAVPAAAMKAIRAAVDGAIMLRIEEIEIGCEAKDGKVVELPKPLTRYAVEMKKGGKTAEIVVSPDGAVVEAPKW